MTLRDDLLEAAGQARQVQPDLAEAAGRFLLAAALPEGAFPDRGGRADLYYTAFGLQGLAALGLLAPRQKAAEGGGFPGGGRSKGNFPAAEAAADPRAGAGAGGSPAPPSFLRRTAAYLARFGDGADLDLVHLAALARCWAILREETALEGDAGAGSVSGDTRGETPGPPLPDLGAMRRRLAAFRAADGGFCLFPAPAAHPGGQVGEASGAGAGDGPAALSGTPYAAMFAVGAMEDLAPLGQESGPSAATEGGPTPSLGPEEADRLAVSLLACQAPAGGFASAPGDTVATVPVTAAAVATLAHLASRTRVPVAEAVERAAAWLLARALPGGGWPAAGAGGPGSPAGGPPAQADLLSTATALHALAAARVSVPAAIRDTTRAWVLRLATPEGGFRGHPDEARPDVEYTFYGLLALGHLGPQDGRPVPAKRPPPGGDA